MAAEYGICWSCQKKLRRSTAVWLADDEAIQCCRRCWGAIPAAERMAIAMQFRDRSAAGFGVEETLSVLRDLIGNSISGYINHIEDPRRRLN
jgi:hypothetical protein